MTAGVCPETARTLVACLLLLSLITDAAHAQEASRVTGRVVSARTKLPVEGAIVVLTGTLFAAVTNENGVFVLEQIPAGTYTVVVMAPDYREDRRDLTLPHNTAISLDIRLRHAELNLAEPRYAADFFARSILRQFDLARRGGMDFVPAMRGFTPRQIGVVQGGVRRLSGSPYGFGWPLANPDYARIDVVNGPYVVTQGPGMLAAVRIVDVEREASGHGLQFGWSTHGLDGSVVSSGTGGRTSWQSSASVLKRRDWRDGAGRRVDASVQHMTIGGGVTVKIGSSSEWTASANYLDSRDLDAAGGQAVAGSWDRIEVSSRYGRTWAHGPLRATDVSVSAERLSHSLGRVMTLDPTRLYGGAAEFFAARVLTRWAAGRNWTVDAGTDYHDVIHRARPVLPRARIADVGVFAQATGMVGAMEVSGAARLDVVLPGEAVERAVSAAAAVRLPLSQVWTLAAGVGTTSRTATVWERFATNSPDVRMPFKRESRGNPGLLPERNTQADLRFEAEWDRLTLDVSAFATRLSGLITPGLVSHYVNGSACIGGVEAWTRYAILGRFAEAYGAAVVVSGRGISSGDLRPMTAIGGLWLAAPDDILTFDVMAHGSHRRHVILDLELGTSLRHSFALTIALRNATGSLWEDPLGAPMAEPGRTLRLRLSRRW